MRDFRLALLTASLATAIVPVCGAQGTLADYRRADSLRARVQGLVVNAPEPATWIAGTSQFWYRKGVRGGNEFVLVDAGTRQKRAPFDHARLATGQILN